MSSTIVFRQIKGFKSWFFQRILKKLEIKKKKKKKSGKCKTEAQLSNLIEHQDDLAQVCIL